jgi:hypothetical protein
MNLTKINMCVRQTLSEVIAPPINPYTQLYWSEVYININMALLLLNVLENSIRDETEKNQ